MFNISCDVNIDQIYLGLSSTSDDIVFSLSSLGPIPQFFVNFPLTGLGDYLAPGADICSSSYSTGYYNGYTDAAHSADYDSEVSLPDGVTVAPATPSFGGSGSNPFVSVSSLDGNGSRYRDGETVKVSSFLEDFKVVGSFMVRTDSQIYTVFYHLLRADESGNFVEHHFIPESLVYRESEVSS